MTANLEAVQRSLLDQLFAALGFPYVILLPVAGFLCFLISLVLVVRGHGSMASASLVLVVHIPLLIGIFAALHGGFASYMVIATSEAAPKPADVAAGISTALVAPMAGMLLMLPAYATAALGGFVRAILTKPNSR